jgi:pseudouridine synthase
VRACRASPAIRSHASPLGATSPRLGHHADRTPGDHDHRTCAVPPLNGPSQPGIRLQRLLAAAGHGSRRQAETLIREGRVQVDGRVAQLGERADPDSQLVTLDGEPIITPSSDIHLLLNKPRGYVVSRHSDRGHPTVFELIADPPPQLRYAGRLDAFSEGLLLLTTDGELVHRVTHPRFGVHRTYEAHVEALPSEDELERLRSGVELDDGLTAPADVRLIQSTPPDVIVEMVLREGRNRQVRRMFDAVGHRVRRLRRVGFGPLAVGDLPPGASRALTSEELHELRALVGLEG